MIGEAIYIRVSDSHETWKCAKAELHGQIHCFPYVELSDVPRPQQVEKKAVGRQRNLGLCLEVKPNILHGLNVKFTYVMICLQMLTNPLLVEGNHLPLGPALFLQNLILNCPVRW